MSLEQILFSVTPLDFEYEALEPLYIEAGKATNLLRGSLGLMLRRLACAPGCRDSNWCPLPAACLYRQIFEGETNGVRPSGYQEAPRPFVLRWDDWGEMRIAPGTVFRTGLHLFDSRTEVLALMLRAYGKLPAAGLGPARAKMRLRRISQVDAAGAQGVLWTSETKGEMPRPATLRFQLGPVEDAPRRVKVRFLSPTEIKQDGQVLTTADFRPLFQRLWERLSFLIVHYAPNGTTAARDILSAGADELIEAAGRVALVRQNLAPMAVSRFSTRTGQTHPLSGLMGEAEYEGDFRLLWAWMKASEWTGVGRQTVWGKGSLRWEMG